MATGLTADLASAKMLGIALISALVTPKGFKRRNLGKFTSQKNASLKMRLRLLGGYC